MGSRANRTRVEVAPDHIDYRRTPPGMWTVVHSIPEVTRMTRVLTAAALCISAPDFGAASSRVVPWRRKRLGDAGRLKSQEIVKLR